MSDKSMPEVGSRWFNNNRKKIFTVAGCVSPCEPDEWEVLYRSDDMPEGQYRRRSLDEWYGTNRHGEPRFVQIQSHSIEIPVHLLQALGSETASN